MSKKSRINLSELRGLTSLVTDATVSVTDLAEDLNRRIIYGASFPPNPIQHLISGIAGLAYSNVRFGTKLIGGGIEKTLSFINLGDNIGLPFKKKETIQAIINGVVGDYLQETDNPLEIPMQLRIDGETLSFEEEDYPKVNGKILLMVHGICMNDYLWTQQGHNHGEALAAELGLTPVYLFYNGGLHISSNGQSLNSLLEKLIETWPVPVEELNIIAHSMGGLISRSAAHYAEEEKNTWRKHLKRMVFLGSPHHGAPLEKLGNVIDVLLQDIFYTKPFARLGKMRSAGVTDLRFGNLVDEDWMGRDRFKSRRDDRQPIPLPKKVDCFTVAGMIGKKSNKLKDQILGDGLVPPESALGKHHDPERKLKFKKGHKFVAYKCNHIDLLSSQKVYNKIRDWFLD